MCILVTNSIHRFLFHMKEFLDCTILRLSVERGHQNRCIRHENFHAKNRLTRVVSHQQFAFNGWICNVKCRDLLSFAEKVENTGGIHKSWSWIAMRQPVLVQTTRVDSDFRAVNQPNPSAFGSWEGRAFRRSIRNLMHFLIVVSSAVQEAPLKIIPPPPPHLQTKWPTRTYLRLDSTRNFRSCILWFWIWSPGFLHLTARTSHGQKEIQ